MVMDEGREVILIDGDEHRSVMETFYLYQSPANAERLRQGIRQHKEEKTKSINDDNEDILCIKGLVG